jgi:hypothetical protein
MMGLLSGARLRRVVEMLHAGIRAGKEQGLVPAVAPADEVRRTAVGASHLEHFTVAVGLADAMSANHYAIAHARSHDVLLSESDPIFGPSVLAG